MAIPDGDLRFTIDLQPGSTGAWTGTLDIPSQNATAIPLANVAIGGELISFDIGVPGAPSLSGRLLNDGSMISGTVSGSTVPFRLARSLPELQFESDDLVPVTAADISGSMDDRPFFASRRHPAVGYGFLPATDRVAVLSRQVEDGKVQLQFDERSGYLRSVLDALHLPIESQSVVFSRTSFQARAISASNPRALYFGDDVVVGFIRGAPFLEFAAQDAQQGEVFYTLDQQNVAKPRILRRDSCLSCHESRNSLDVPGLLVRSVGVSRDGETQPQLGNYVSDHRSPFDERWGGWYVTGVTAPFQHMGISAQTLQGKFDLAGYPARSSDVAALMVLDHQARMTNLLTRMGWEVRAALYQEEKTGRGNDITERVLAQDARELVDYLLFVDEAPIPSGIQIVSPFAKVFAARGPRDTQGRTLRQLDLTSRLLRYPCSYMIYSAAFDALPETARDAIYKRMWDVLSGKEKDPRYSRLAAADRNAIVQILRDTKKDLPGYYR